MSTVPAPPFTMDNLPFRRIEAYPLSTSMPYTYKETLTLQEEIEEVKYLLGLLVKSDNEQTEAYKQLIEQANDAIESALAGVLQLTIDYRALLIEMDGKLAAQLAEVNSKVVALVAATNALNAATERANQLSANFIAKVAEFTDAVAAFKNEHDADIAKVTANGKINNATSFPGVYADGSRTSTGLQAAIDASVGGRLFLPKGTYKIEKVLYMRSNVIMEGNDATILRVNGYSGTILGFYKESNDTTTGYNGIHDVEVRGITFDGGPSTGVAGNMVSVNHSKNVRFYNCKFIRCEGYHHLEFNSTMNGVADECQFLGHIFMRDIGWRKEAVQIDCSNEGSVGTGARDGIPARNITVSNCYFGPDEYGNPAPPVMVGSHTVPTTDMNYDNINVYNCIGDGVTLAGVWALKWANSSVRDIVVKLSPPSSVPAGADLAATRYGVRLHTSTKVNVDGCKVYHNPDWVESIGYSCNEASNRCKVTNNYVEYSNIGLHVRSSEYAMFSGNSTWRTLSYGAISEFGSTVTFQNNVFQSANYKNIGSGNMRIGDGDSNTTVSTNVFLGNGVNDPSQYISIHPTSANWYLFGNRGRGYSKVTDSATVNGGNNSLT